MQIKPNILVAKTVTSGKQMNSYNFFFEFHKLVHTKLGEGWNHEHGDDY